MMFIKCLYSVLVLTSCSIAVYAVSDTGSVEISQQSITNTTLTTEDGPTDPVSMQTSESKSSVQCRTPLYQQTQFYYLPVSGTPGMPGLQGRNGEPGITGVMGTTGYSGNNGNYGNDGITGPIGRSGINGQKGEQGLEGVCGQSGQDGVPGLNGYRGESGSFGPRGPTGPEGKPGARGPVGPQGEEGRIGFPGKTGAQGRKGLPGTYSASNALNKKYRAFSVALNSNVVAENGDMIIKWDHEFSNVGGDFDMETGVFNVTVPGTYFFIFHVCKTSRQTFPHVQLVKNGESVVSATDYGPNDSDDSSDNSVILTLRKNDVIWMVLTDERELASTPYKFTTFSGFLIFPMPI